MCQRNESLICEKSMEVYPCSVYCVKITYPVLLHSLLEIQMSGSNISKNCLRSFMKCVSMAEQLHTSLSSLCAMPSVGWSGVKHGATALRSSGNVFSGVMNPASLCGRLMHEFGFGRCNEIQVLGNRE